MTLEECILNHIHKTLIESDWNQRETSRRLQVSERYVRYKVAELRDKGYEIPVRPRYPLPGVMNKGLVEAHRKRRENWLKGHYKGRNFENLTLAEQEESLMRLTRPKKGSL